MQFNSLLFLFLFLPLVLMLALATGKKIRNIALLLFSMIFYVWAGVGISVILVFSIIFNYFSGRKIQSSAGSKNAKKFLAIAVTVNILLLVFFKYTNFLFDNINHLAALMGSAPVMISKLAVPLGISFFTFCSISYLIDIYRGESRAEKNFVNFALYLSFFPRIIAGPITRYKETRDELTGRKISLENFAKGIERFIMGLAKKVMIADTFAVVADQVFSMPAGDLTFYNTWIGIIAYTFQLYVDFSGYSDMAIGIGKMLGFNIPENFNFPYLARSVQEFWQRWHITLSSWLRDYLFTPLSLQFRSIRKKGIALSLLITFALCGLWHNAGWHFIIWGLIHGVFLTIESLGFGVILKKLWRPLRHLYLILVVMFGWLFFRSDNMAYAFHYCAAMFNFSSGHQPHEVPLIFDMNTFIVCLVVTIAGSVGVFTFISKFFNTLSSRFSPRFREAAILSYSIIEMISLFLIFLLAITYIAVNNYQPFIYFRF